MTNELDAGMKLAIAKILNEVDLPEGILRDASVFTEWMTKLIVRSFLSGAHFALVDARKAVEAKLAEQGVTNDAA